MRRKPLEFGQCRQRRCVGLHAGPANSPPASSCAENPPYASPMENAAAPDVRQGVIGARQIVARGHGRRRPDEDRTDSANLRHPRVRIAHHQRQVLGREALDDGRISSSPPAWISTCWCRAHGRRSHRVRWRGERAVEQRGDVGQQRAVARHGGDARAKRSCSACATSSPATSSGAAESSATTSTSEGPASPSIPHTPKTCRFASVTYTLPGPTILSTRAMVAVP